MLRNSAALHFHNLHLFIIINDENRTRGTEEIIKPDITESLQTKQNVHSANCEQKKPKSLKVHK